MVHHIHRVMLLEDDARWNNWLCRVCSLLRAQDVDYYSTHHHHQLTAAAVQWQCCRQWQEVKYGIPIYSTLRGYHCTPQLTSLSTASYREVHAR
jgi:hypothetical protein